MVSSKRLPSHICPTYRVTPLRVIFRSHGIINTSQNHCIYSSHAIVTLTLPQTRAHARAIGEGSHYTTRQLLTDNSLALEPAVPVTQASGDP